ncbi:CD5 antigen-like [Camelus dromedarius]|uniref:CD5 antigen-like n=1 Tax=Camelus dromedarius TaxID=9838 RepID=A0A5N4CP01_CAMDR|nr:CD5 antigen-like [Camelus dromedarius]
MSSTTYSASASFNSTFVLENASPSMQHMASLASMQQSADWVSDTPLAHLPEEFLGTAQTIHRDPFHVRLVGGESKCSGRLEVLHKGDGARSVTMAWGERRNRWSAATLGCGEPVFVSAKDRRKSALGMAGPLAGYVFTAQGSSSPGQVPTQFWGITTATTGKDVLWTA